MLKNPKLANFLKLVASLFEEQDRLKNIPYHDYLHTTHWKQLRTLKLKEVDNRCQLCYSPKRLHVHHRTYERLGHERMSDLTVLCKECHDVFHKYRTLDKTPKKRYNKKKKE